MVKLYLSILALCLLAVSASADETVVECGVSAECRVQSAELSSVQSAELSSVQSAELSSVQSAECRVQSSECHSAAQLCTLHSALCTEDNSALCTEGNSALCTQRLELLPWDELMATLAANKALENAADTVLIPATAEKKTGYRFFKSVPVEKPYKFMDDMTFVGIPIFAAGLLFKSQKFYFRQNTTDQDPLREKDRLLPSFNSGVDDYLQFAPIALAVGLKLGGVDGRSDWGRFLACSLGGYGIMAALVNGIKYSVKEMRPDGSTANSFPSGHTATVFVGATILHKEYGLTTSPWYSIGGYAVATATGVLRVLNNRHWISDVIAGAGIGILSTELAYGLCDLIFKGKGLRRTDLEGGDNIITKPTFFSINMGFGIGNRDLTFHATNPEITQFLTEEETVMPFRLKTASFVSVEGAYFFNKYIGIGGRLAMRATSVDGFDTASANLNAYYRELANNEFWQTMLHEDKIQVAKDFQAFNPDTYRVTVESDHLTEFTATAGIYLNLPLSSRFALGAKFLVGRSYINDLDLDMEAEGCKMALSEIQNPNGQYTHLLSNTGETYKTKWDYININGDSTMTYGTGISLTFAYKPSFSWRVFADYDYARKHYTLTTDALGFLREAYSKDVVTLMPYDKLKKHMNKFTFGGAFCVSF